MAKGFVCNEDVFQDQNGKVFRAGEKANHENGRLRFLVARKGKTISIEQATNLGLMEPASMKASAPAENKGLKPEANKGKK